jgi:hypothetical protein
VSGASCTLPAPSRGEAAEPDTLLALSLARRLAALDEGPVRARAAARALAAMDPDRAVGVIAALARSGTPAARIAVAAAAQAVADPREDLPYAWLAELYAAATSRGATDVAALLLSPAPYRAWEPPRDKADARLAHLTLGHKKALARLQRDPDLLARLAAEGDPLVVRELLRNPQLTEPFVVRIASRRPCRPEALRSIHESRRWRTRPAVALALVRNPYAETGLALRLLATLATADLRDVARDGVLHPLVRAVAARVAEMRGRSQGE